MLVGHRLANALTDFLTDGVASVAVLGRAQRGVFVRAAWDTFATAVVTELPVVSSFREAINRLHRALEHLPDPVRWGRTDQLTTLVIGTLAGWEWAHDRGQSRLPAELLAAELIATGLAVVTAPAPSARRAPASTRTGPDDRPEQETP